MSVYVKGFNNLIDGDFKNMIITENDEGYLVKVKNGKKERIFSDEVNDSNTLLLLVQYFTKSATLNKVGIRKSLLKNKLLFVAKGNKKLSLEVNDDNLDDVYKAVIEKYIADRENFVSNQEFDVYSIDLNSEISNYDVDYSGIRDVVNFNLLCDEDGDLLSFEKTFLSKFIYNKLSSIGERAKILADYEFSEPTINLIDKKSCDEYLICCGDTYIKFSNEREFMFLFGLVEKYNKSLENGKKRVKKVGN